MKSRIAISAGLTALSIAFGATAAHAGCIPIAGFASLTPELSGTCTIAAANPGHAYLGSFGTCFAVTLKKLNGSALGSGFSGLTTEATVSPFGASRTPHILNEAGVPSYSNSFGPETRRLFTARSALTLLGGTILTADAGSATVLNGGLGLRSMEELIITGGSGAHAGASGVIYLNGTIVGGHAPFAGQICTPTP